MEALANKALPIPSRVPVHGDTRVWAARSPLNLDSGASLHHYSLAYRTWGTLNSNANNAVLVVHALSGSADLEAWWPDLLGEGKPLDPSRDFVICINLLGSCYGSSGPIAPRNDSALADSWKSDFPIISVRDQVRAQAALIRSLGIKKLRCIIGPSLGGMIALEWALLEPELTGSLVLIATTAFHCAQAIASSECQRAAIRLDPHFNDGQYDVEQQPKHGLSLARRLAFIGYRCEQELAQRFGRQSGEQHSFSVLDYLSHQGEKFVARFDANSYIRLTQCMNTHDLGRDRGSVETALQSISQPTLVISLDSDQLYPIAEQKLLAKHIPNAEHVVISSRYGHDGFLIESEAMSGVLTPFLQFRCKG